jgi:hypothetical protein
MRWTEQVILAHRDRLSQRPPDRREELIARWEQARSGAGPQPAIEKARELLTDGNNNETELGFHVLMDLALTEPSLRTHVSQLASHRSAAVRRKLAFYLSRALPPEFHTAVYGTLLRDKAGSVRVQTITRIGMLNFKCLLPELRSLRAVERNGKVIQELDYWIPLLEAGYRVEPSPTPGMLEVTVLTGNGIASMEVKATGPHDPRIRRAVKELRARH